MTKKKREHKNQNLQDDNVEYEVEVLRHSLPHCCSVFVGIGLHKPFYVLLTGPDNYSKTFEGEDLPILLQDALEDSFQFKPCIEIDGTKTIEEVSSELARLIKEQKPKAKVRERRAVHIAEIEQVTKEAEADAEKLTQTLERLNSKGSWESLAIYLNEIYVVIESWRAMMESEEGDSCDLADEAATDSPRHLTAEDLAALRRVSKGPEV